MKLAANKWSNFDFFGTEKAFRIKNRHLRGDSNWGAKFTEGIFRWQKMLFNVVTQNARLVSTTFKKTKNWF